MEIVFALIVIVAVAIVFVLFKNTKAGYERQIDELKKQLETEREYAKRMLDQADDNLQQANKNLERERQHAEDLRKESDQRWEQKLESLKKDMQHTAAKELAAKQEELQRANRTQMDDLLRPIKEQFTDFKRAVNESKTQNEVNKTELQKAFENTMKLFQQQQQQTVDSLKQQTERIGEDAANLSRALKGESKTQGDWGEMVLETLLENSGLQRDEEFFVQESVKNEDGATFRPDVVVRFPEGRSVVIDSKVSLTAYADAVATDDEHERDRLRRSKMQSTASVNAPSAIPTGSSRLVPPSVRAVHASSSVEAGLRRSSPPSRLLWDLLLTV